MLFLLKMRKEDKFSMVPVFVTAFLILIIGVVILIYAGVSVWLVLLYLIGLSLAVFSFKRKVFK